MATIAFDSGQARNGAKAPISVHPAFPAIVALWFAALLGLGSLVLPVVLVERAVEATGIASLVPAASPPLGMTARAVIALVGAGFGAMLGIAIARRVASAHAPKPESRIAKLAFGSRRPISVHDELGGEGLVNGESLPINRRRALAISEDDRPSDFLYTAPLPGEDPYAAPAADEPLELSELAEEPADPIEVSEPEFGEDQDPEMTEEFEPDFAAVAEEEPQPEAADERQMRNNLGGARGFEPLPFSPPSLARRAPEPEFEPEYADEDEVEVEIHLEAVTAPAIAPDADELRADWETAPLDKLGLVQLVQRLGSTIERRRELQAQGPSMPAAPVAPVSPLVEDLDAAPAEEAAQAMAAYFGAPAAAEPVPVAGAAETSEQVGEVPAEPAPDALPGMRDGFLRALAAVEEDDEEDDSVASFSLPLRRTAEAAPIVTYSADLIAASEAAAGDSEEDEAEESSEAGYGSLLATNPFAAPKTEFVRIEEPEDEADMAEPAVVFPGHEATPRFAAPQAAGDHRLFDRPGNGTTTPAGTAQRAPGDADEALRAALATLQRMSGAA